MFNKLFELGDATWCDPYKNISARLSMWYIILLVAGFTHLRRLTGVSSVGSLLNFLFIVLVPRGAVSGLLLAAALHVHPAISKLKVVVFVRFLREVKEIKRD